MKNTESIVENNMNCKPGSFIFYLHEKNIWEPTCYQELLTNMYAYVEQVNESKYLPIFMNFYNQIFVVNGFLSPYAHLLSNSRREESTFFNTLVETTRIPVNGTDDTFMQEVISTTSKIKRANHVSDTTKELTAFLQRLFKLFSQNDVKVMKNHIYPYHLVISALLENVEHNGTKLYEGNDLFHAIIDRLVDLWEEGLRGRKISDNNYSDGFGLLST